MAIAALTCLIAPGVASASATASISGVVTSNGQPTAANVSYFNRATNASLGNVTANSLGQYTITGLTPGTYAVSFAPLGGPTPGTPGNATIYYGGGFYVGEAGTITLADGEAKTGIDGNIVAAAGVTGKVTDSQGAAVSGVRVHFTPVGSGVTWSTSTKSDGTYSEDSRTPGDYLVSFIDTAGTHGSAYYLDKPTASGATHVTLTAGSFTPGINQVLGDGGRISGHVTDPQGHAVANATVYVSSTTGAPYGSANTAADGSYTLGGLQAASYSVYAYPPYGTTTFGYSPRSGYVTPVVGQVTPGIDIQLVATGSSTPGQIKGHVTLPGGADASGYPVSLAMTYGGTYKSTVTDGNGDYAFPGLPAGSYRVRFGDKVQADGYTPVGTYATTYYPHGATADDPNTTAVSVTVGADTSIDFTLEATRTISGHLTDSSGQPASNGMAALVASNGNLLTAYSFAGEDGSYSFNYLPAGKYRVAFAPPGKFVSKPGTRYFAGSAAPGGVTSVAQATTIDLTTGTTRSDVDEAFPEVAQISGAVYEPGADPTNPTDDFSEVTLYDANKTPIDTTQVVTGYNGGYYDFGGLAPGTYYVGVSASGTGAYGPWFYASSATLAGATPIVVGHDQAIYGLNITPPAPTPSPTPGPATSPSPSPSPTTTAVPTPTPPATPTPVPTPAATSTPVPTPTGTTGPTPTVVTAPSPTPVPTASPSPTGSPGPTPTVSPGASVTPVPTPKPTPTAMPTPTGTPNLTPTPTPTPTVTATPAPQVDQSGSAPSPILGAGVPVLTPVPAATPLTVLAPTLNLSKPLVATSSTVAITLTCPAGTTCSGTVLLTAQVKKGKKTTTVIVGQQTISGSGDVSVKLTPAGKKLLKAGNGKLTVKLTVTPKGSSSPTVTKTVKLAPAPASSKKSKKAAA